MKAKTKQLAAASPTSDEGSMEAGAALLHHAFIIYRRSIYRTRYAQRRAAGWTRTRTRADSRASTVRKRRWRANRKAAAKVAI